MRQRSERLRWLCALKDEVAWMGGWECRGGSGLETEVAYVSVGLQAAGRRLSEESPDAPSCKRRLNLFAGVLAGVGRTAGRVTRLGDSRGILLSSPQPHHFLCPISCILSASFLSHPAPLSPPLPSLSASLPLQLSPISSSSCCCCSAGTVCYDYSSWIAEPQPLCPSCLLYPQYE